MGGNKWKKITYVLKSNNRKKYKDQQSVKIRGN